MIPGAVDYPTNPLERFYPVANFTWSTAQGRGAYIGGVNFPDCLLSIPFIADKIEGYRLLRTDFEVSVRVNGNSMVYGSFLLGYDPATHMDAMAAAEVNLYSISGGPCMLVSAAATDVPSLKLPYIHPYPAIDLSTFESGCLGTLDLMVLNALTGISSAAVGASINVAVYARMVNPVLECPTSVSVITLPTPLAKVPLEVP